MKKMKYEKKGYKEMIEKDICLFCGTNLDYQNEGELDFDDNSDPFFVIARIFGVRCPDCGASHYAKFVIDKDDYVSCNTGNWQVRVAGGSMNIYGTREKYCTDTDTIQYEDFDFYMDCVSINAELRGKQYRCVSIYDEE